MKIKFSPSIYIDLIIIELLGVSIWLTFFQYGAGHGSGNLIKENICGLTQ